MGRGNLRGLATTSGRREYLLCDADTGEARWFYQWSHHDLHEHHDLINENGAFGFCPSTGRAGKVLVRPERNGYVYVLDRVTWRGSFRQAVWFSYMRPRASIQKPVNFEYVPEKAPRLGCVVGDIFCLHPLASRTDNLLQPCLIADRSTSHITICAWMKKECATQLHWRLLHMSLGRTCERIPVRVAICGEFTAWDVQNGKAVWSIKDKFPSVEWSFSDCRRPGFLWNSPKDGLKL